MSADMQALSALAMKTGCPMRFFELVQIVNGPLERKCFIGLGKHSMFFMRLNWADQIHGGGELAYAHVERVLIDSQSRTSLMFLLNDNRPPEWVSERLYIVSEQRELFCRHFRCNWQTDYMWRIGKVSVCPCSDHALTQSKAADGTEIVPFMGWCWKEYEDYKFMVPQSYREQPNAIQESGTGEFQDPDPVNGSTLVVQVHELKTLDQALCMGLDHIRWVAAQYKLSLLRDEKHFYVLRNAPYQKKMNLGGDIASWSAWEMIIKTQQITLIVMLLRRQYVPPVFNNIQDIAVIMRCPDSPLRDRSAERQFTNSKIQELQLIANSLKACASSVSVYREVLQAKLNALRFDDLGVAWTRAYLKLTPQGACGRQQAKRILRALLKMFIEDGAIKDEENILNASPLHVIVNADPGEKWRELPDIEICDFIRGMKYATECGLPDENDRPEGVDQYNHLMECRSVRNQWFLRVARYLAWAIDGGVLGRRFDFDVMIGSMHQLSEDSYKTVQWVLAFCLHNRPRDMTKHWEEASITNSLRIGKFDNSLPYTKADSVDCYTFNEQVMIQLLRTEFVRKAVFGDNRKNEYYHLLGNFLKQGCGINLKTHVCRLFMEGCGHGIAIEVLEEMISPLAHLMSKGGAFLGTYASAALVNLTHNNYEMKSKLIVERIPEIICQQLKVKDDDLVAYVLMLTVNMTKENTHRQVIASYGLLTMIYDILTSTYALGASKAGGIIALSGDNSIKVKILTQVSIIIGQYCNDDVYRKEFQKQHVHTIACLVFIYMESQAFSVLACKALFALKQVSIDHGGHKLYITSYVASKLVEELFADSLAKTVDFYNQAILLLQTLVMNKDCCQRLTAVEPMELSSQNLERLSEDPKNKLVQSSPDLQTRIDHLARAIGSHEEMNLIAV